MNVQHLPVQGAYAPLPPEIVEAMKPGSVTLLCASPRVPLSETLIALALESSKTLKTSFVNLRTLDYSLNKRLFSVILGKNLLDIRNTQMTDADLERLKTFAFEANTLSNLELVSLPSQFICADDLQGLSSPNGTIVIDVAQLLLQSPQGAALQNPQFVANLAKSRNVAIVEGVLIKAEPDNPSAVIPGLSRYERPLVEIADSVFVLHDENLCSGNIAL